MSPSKILQAWEKRWAVPLTELQREDFLSRPETLEIQRYRQAVVLESIGKFQKLTQILGNCQALQALDDWEPPQRKWKSGHMINPPPGW